MTEREKMIKMLEEEIRISIRFEHCPDTASWNYQEGILISQNQAQTILKLLKENKDGK